jgi:hypothetical protein
MYRGIFNFSVFDRDMLESLKELGVSQQISQFGEVPLYTSMFEAISPTFPPKVDPGQQSYWAIFRPVSF